MEHESYVSLEIAKMLKQLGFDWMCPSLYGMDIRHNGRHIDEDEEYELKSSGRVDEIEHIDGGTVYNIYNNNKDPYCYSRPTLAVAQRWLREVKGIEIDILCVYINNAKKYSYCVFEGKYNNERIEEGFDTFEEAQEAGIKKALDIILEKGE